MQASPLKIGTRGSPLALAQATMVRDRLMAAHGLAPDRLRITVIRTGGDRIQDRPLSEVGGKGLFTKEIEDALAAGTIDLAVHSAKDMATKLPDGLIICAALEREDVRDAFISLAFRSLSDLPSGATVGTSSLRRQAQVLRFRPDLRVVGFRGNVETRLAKLESGVADATLLAVAGLKRLGMNDRITAVIETDEMLPAVAQGAVIVQVRADAFDIQALVAPLDHQETRLCITAERAFLARLDGSCRTPISGLARLDGGCLTLAGELLSHDGSESYSAQLTGPAAAALDLGTEVADTLIDRAGAHFVARLRNGSI